MIKIKKPALKIDDSSNNKKVYFGDDGEEVDVPAFVKATPAKAQENVVVESATNGEHKKGFKKRYQPNHNELETKWYQLYQEHNTSEFKDIKDAELTSLQNLCKNSFNEEVQKLQKSKWNWIL